MKQKELTGMRFGHWIVKSQAEKCRRGKRWWVMCDCGQVRIANHYHLLSGLSTSCGCKSGVGKLHGPHLPRDRHGHAGRYSRTRTYRIWKAMRTRCNNPNIPQFYLWGGKGVKVCDRWNSFEKFLADMGECPDGYSIDRIDSNGNYCKENCRWADSYTQAMNTSRYRKNV